MSSGHSVYTGSLHFFLDIKNYSVFVNYKNFKLFITYVSVIQLNISLLSKG